MGIKELKQRRADLKAEGRKLLETPAANRSEEQTKRLDAVVVEAEQVDKDIQLAEKFADDERAQGTVPHAPRMSTSGVPTSGLWDGQDEEKAARELAARAMKVPKVYHGFPGLALDKLTQIKAAFGQQLLDVYHWYANHTMSPQLQEIQAAAQGAGEKIGSDGGFFVQTDVSDELIREVFEVGQLLGRLRRVNIGPNSNGLTIRAYDETSRATGSRFGGVQGYWVDEGTAPTASKPKFRKLELKLNKLALLGYATDELLQDAVAMGDIMFQAFAEEGNFMVEDAVVNGTGSGQPLGLLNSDAEVSVAKETGQAAATVVKENIDKMYSRMRARNRANAVWLTNQDIEPQLEQLAMTVGTGGVPIYLPPGGITETPNARLKGRPVIPTEYNATLGTVGDIILVDLMQYLFIAKLMQMASSMHVAFTTDEMAFRVTWRVDGKPAWVSALTPYKGTATVSPIISLATRA